MFYPVPDDMRFVAEKAEQLGLNDNGIILLKRSLEEPGFYITVALSQDGCEVNVFEEPDDEEYYPFSVTSNKGGFVTAIREQVLKVLDEIWNQTCEISDVRALIVQYMCDKYRTVPETPWENYPQHETFKTTRSGKWYAIIMEVRYEKIGIERDELANLINVKANPEDIKRIIDNVHYFPAYHMNKTHWITILLDNHLDLDEAKSLIDASYDLVEK